LRQSFLAVRQRFSTVSATLKVYTFLKKPTL